MNPTRIKLFLLLVVVLLGINGVLYKLNHNSAFRHNNTFLFNGQSAVFTDRVSAIQNVVIDSATGSRDERLVSTEEFTDRFTIPADMELIVGQRYEFTIKREGRGYPRAVDAVQK